MNIIHTFIHNRTEIQGIPMNTRTKLFKRLQKTFFEIFYSTDITEADLKIRQAAQEKEKTNIR